MTDQLVDTSPEEVAVVARLAALRSDWVTPELRSAALENARDAAFHREGTETLANARQAVQAATESRDLLALQAAAAEVMVAEQVIASLPPVAGAVYVPAACDGARDELQAAVSRIQAPGTLSLELELAAFESWPELWRAKGKSPICLPAEQVLLDSVRAFRHESTDNHRAVASWAGEQVQGDTIRALELAETLLTGLGEVSGRGAALSEQVTEANVRRLAMGIEWDAHQWPNSDTADSEALRALRRYRRERDAVLA